MPNNDIIILTAKVFKKPSKLIFPNGFIDLIKCGGSREGGMRRREPV